MKMLLHFTSALVIACAFTSCYATHDTKTKGFHGASAHANAGCGYINACKAALQAPILKEGAYVCQWPDEYPGSDEPGAAYREGQAAAEDADCHND